MKVAFATLGCKVNHYETEAMRELFTGSGWECVPFPEPADVYIVNTCTVTGTGDSKSRQLIARAHRASPDALIVVTGCYAQTAPEAVSSLEGVGLVIGTDGRSRIVRRVEEALAGRRADHVPPLGRMRAFIRAGGDPSKEPDMAEDYKILVDEYGEYIFVTEEDRIELTTEERG